MAQLIENFDVGVVYPLRTYERHQFSLSVHGKEYKGDYHDDIIHWLHPHPKQDIDEEQLLQIESSVYEMLGNHGVKDDVEDIKVERMLNKAHTFSNAHRFKLQIRGEEFQGICRDNQIDWSHPKPQDKLEHDEIEELEEKVHQKVKGHHLGFH